MNIHNSASQIEHQSHERKGGWQQIASALVNQIFPPTCVACDEATETPVGLCGTCWRDIYFLTGNLCQRCGTPLQQMAEDGAQPICDTCLFHPPAWDQGRCACAYDGAAKRAVLSLKYSDRTDLVPALAKWLTGAGANLLHQDTIVVPVPLHPRRLATRRYNQAAELARALAQRSGTTAIATALARQTDTPPQKGTRAERQATVAQAFTLNLKYARQLSGRDILLVDDVMTTGATLSACAETLRKAGPNSVNVLALARALREH